MVIAAQQLSLPCAMSTIVRLPVQWQNTKPAQFISEIDTKTVPVFKIKAQCAGNTPNTLI